jgi:hypothetical protein
MQHNEQLSYAGKQTTVALRFRCCVVKNTGQSPGKFSSAVDPTVGFNMSPCLIVVRNSRSMRHPVTTLQPHSLQRSPNVLRVDV